MSGYEELDVPADWFVGRLPSRRARDVAQTIAGFIQGGELRNGARLPTIRDLSAVVGVSVGTIADVWNELRERGLITTNRRGGTVVTKQQSTTRHEPFPGWVRLDLANGTPDPRLQPALANALQAGLQTPNLHVSRKERMTAALHQAVAPTWPFTPQAWTTAGGGVEGELLAIAAAAPAGSLVAVEEPTSPRIINALASLDLVTVGVACDSDGPLPEALAQALTHKPAAFVFQPCAQLPLGFTLGETRARQLATVLEQGGREVVVVEDDATGPVALANPASLACWIPDQVLHVRAYCKTYGVDLRTCVVAGAATLVERFDQLRSFGGGMTSRILQDALAFLITDPSTQLAVKHARATYARRRNKLVSALAAEGVKLNQPDGLVLWLPVQDEAAALVSLATHGISAGAGRRCFVSMPAAGYIRIAISHLPDDEALIQQLAGWLLEAMAGQTQEEFD